MNKSIIISLSHARCHFYRAKVSVFVERLWRSVKYAEVYLNAYESASEAKQSLAKYFHFYNKNRKHQTLMATPDQVYYESVRLQKAG